MPEENLNDDVQDSSPAEETVVSEDVETPVEPAPQPIAEKVVPYSRFKEVNDELAALKARPAKAVKTLDVEDYIDISASLEGLDQTEKSFLAEQHKLSGRPLSEIRSGENFLLWQQGYQAKVEKERALKPSSTQPESEKPKSLADKLRNASLAEMEKILAEQGHTWGNKHKQERVNIGGAKTI